MDLRRAGDIGHLPTCKPYFAMNAGLCASCRHQKLIHNTRGSTFSMCERSKTDERYPKYPRLPVVECAGWERREAGASRGNGT
jgi:hypothetical protein